MFNYTFNRRSSAVVTVIESLFSSFLLKIPTFRYPAVDFTSILSTFVLIVFPHNLFLHLFLLSMCITYSFFFLIQGLRRLGQGRRARGWQGQREGSRSRREKELAARHPRSHRAPALSRDPLGSRESAGAQASSLRQGARRLTLFSEGVGLLKSASFGK